MVKKCALSIGSNKGGRESNIKKAVSIIEKRAGTEVKKSPVYESPPLYNENQNDFLNCCISFDTEMNAEELHSLTLAAEKECGRKKKKGKGPRTVDIDIIFLGDDIVADDKLSIPHVDMQNRLFVLRPLADIMGSFIHPVLQLKVKDLLAECPDRSRLKKIKNFWE